MCSALHVQETSCDHRGAGAPAHADDFSCYSHCFIQSGVSFHVLPQRDRQAITEAHETLRMQLAAAVALSANLMTRNAALEKQHLIAAKHWSSDQAMTVSIQ